MAFARLLLQAGAIIIETIILKMGFTDLKEICI